MKLGSSSSSVGAREKERVQDKTVLEQNSGFMQELQVWSRVKYTEKYIFVKVCCKQPFGVIYFIFFAMLKK